LWEGSQEFELGAAIGDNYLKDATNNNAVFEITRNLMISYAENPQYGNIKNDITIWGETSATKSPIRYRVLIGKLPAAVADEEGNFESYKLK
jgi:hypothetical protein